MESWSGCSGRMWCGISVRDDRLFEDVAAAGVVGAAVEGTVGAVAEDKGAAATGAFAGGDCGVAPLFVGADIAYVFFA